MKYKIIKTREQKSVRTHAVSAFLLTTAILLTGLSCAEQEHDTNGTVRDPNPLILYVVSDVHIGSNDTGENMRAFARMVNENRPDVVLDLGDTFQAEKSELYDFDTHEKAAHQQHRDWLEAWNSIEIEYKAVALGNRDVHPAARTDRHTLSDENLWITDLGYEDNPVRGGTKLQTSFIAEGGDVRALVFAFCTYLESFSMEETLNWVRDEVTDFDGDFIIFSSHHVGVYEDLKEILVENNVQTPAILLHGHNHGPDTLVRDAWGLEQDDFDFPSYLVTDLMDNGIGARFDLYPDGQYEKFRIDVKNQTISEPVMHYQTRVERE